jgi:hypothetical protein
MSTFGIHTVNHSTPSSSETHTFGKSDEKDVAVMESTTAVLTVDSPTTEDELLDEPYTLPPLGDHQLTKLEQEFRDMLIDFSQFTRRDIMAVKNPRIRSLFEGVAASYSLPEVHRAFEVLFEDYAPLRVAGRLIYGKLKQVMVEAQSERHKEVEEVAATTGLTKEDVEACRNAFFSMVVHRDDRATEMTIEQLVDYGLAETAVEVLGYDSFDEFLTAADVKANQKVGFGDLMVALQSCAINSPYPECNPATVVQEIANRLKSRDALHPESLDQRKKKFIARYEIMVEKFKEWKDLVPPGDGRRLDVLRGCFVGASSKEIVAALRIVYVDYSALRVSGNLIFKVMEKLIGSAGNRR